MVNSDLPDLCCSFKFGNKKNFICTLRIFNGGKNSAYMEYDAYLERWAGCQGQLRNCSSLVHFRERDWLESHLTLFFKNWLKGHNFVLVNPNLEISLVSSVIT